MAKDLTDTLIAPAFVRGMLSRIGTRGADVAAYLQRVGADTAVLTDPAHPGISSHQYVALFYTLAQELKDESVGLFSRPFKLGSFALVARTGMGAPDLGSAVRRMSKVLNLLQDDLLFSLAVQKDEAGLDVFGGRFGRRREGGQRGEQQQGADQKGAKHPEMLGQTDFTP